MMPELSDYSGSRAVLIGTATYHDPEFPPLPAAANSLTGMRQILTDPALCGWPHERITVVKDPTDAPRLVQTLRRLARDADGVLLLYFVGHGVILRQGRLCLVLADTDAEDPDITGLEYQRVREALLDSPARLKVVIIGHAAGVESVAFSPDGAILASGSDDMMIRLWSVDTHDCIGILRGHTNAVESVAFSPDGKVLASGSEDATIRFWDVARRTSQATITGHADAIGSVAFSPHAMILASGDSDHTVRLWNAANGTAISVLDGHSGIVYSVAFRPDGGVLASGGADETVRLWDVATRSTIAVLAGHTAVIYSVEFSPDGTTLASGGSDNTVRLWQID